MSNRSNRKHPSNLKEALVVGYRHMAELNLALAQEDEETFGDWVEYEEGLAEDDSSGCP